MSSSNSTVFVVREESDLNHAYDFAEEFLKIHDQIEVVIGLPETRRTKLQHNWYFEIVSQIAELGKFNKEALHVWLKKEFLGLTPETIFGDTVNITPTTTKLTVKAMSDYISQVERFAAEKGIELIYPNYYGEIHR